MTSGDKVFKIVIQRKNTKLEHNSHGPLKQSEVGSGAIEEWASSADSPIGFTKSIYMKNNYSIICM